jgi:hypothetical protein
VDLIKEKLTNPKRLVVEIPDVNEQDGDGG